MNENEIIISTIFSNKKKYDDEIQEEITNFLEKASYLVEMSNDLYQIEHTVLLNKISLKDYILNSGLTEILEENNINNYSTHKLKTYLNTFMEKGLMEDTEKYRLALDLFEQLEKIEIITYKKINKETSSIGKFIPLVNRINEFNKSNYEEIFNQIRKKAIDFITENGYQNTNIYTSLMEIINDIYEYYSVGIKIWNCI